MANDEKLRKHLAEKYGKKYTTKDIKELRAYLDKQIEKAPKSVEKDYKSMKTRHDKESNLLELNITKTAGHAKVGGVDPREQGNIDESKRQTMRTHQGSELVHFRDTKITSTRGFDRATTGQERSTDKGGMEK